jgi:hypothetical protein
MNRKPLARALRALALAAVVIAPAAGRGCQSRNDEPRQKPEPEKRPCVFVGDPPVKRCP